MDRYVFAAVKYANAAPLAHFLPRVDGRAAVTYGRPSSLLAELESGRADAALIPVAAFLAAPGLRMIDGIGICADGRVESVLIKCRRPLAEVRLVEPDAASRTSNALAAILLGEHVHLAAEVRPARPGERADAAVCIGDRALREPPAPAGDYDMAAMWKEMTGLPFVFAVWAYRAGFPDPEGLAGMARAALAEGVRRIEELAAIQAEKLSLPIERLREYFRRSVRYELGPREGQAMGLFGEKLTQRGLIGPLGGLRRAAARSRADAAQRGPAK
jgi:chorismate dehydratase